MIQERFFVCSSSVIRKIFSNCENGSFMPRDPFQLYFAESEAETILPRTLLVQSFTDTPPITARNEL
ncbi:hypothetical protein JTE90_016733 [Oedothorax gibbosus]|uniref:Uncharacterized protein n=1 Tax=Oedothorax gibbosus TaxID=931172 RepID=A0AAV6TR20_9ARAC|nr:hypothetical protein JTE90_016733 [Oedothorax gibbosus]